MHGKWDLCASDIIIIENLYTQVDKSCNPESIDYMRADSAIGFFKKIWRCEIFAHMELFYIVIVISTQNLKFIA